MGEELPKKAAELESSVVATTILRSYWSLAACVLRTIILDQVPSFLHSHGNWYGSAEKVDSYISRATSTSSIYFMAVLLLFSSFLVKVH